MVKYQKREPIRGAGAATGAGYGDSQSVLRLLFQLFIKYEER